MSKRLTDERLARMITALATPQIYAGISATGPGYDRLEVRSLAREVAERRAAEADEIRRLREFVERIVTLCEWGPSAFYSDSDEDVHDHATRLGLFVTVPHVQPCQDESCGCDGATELLNFAWSAAPPSGTGRETE